MHLAKQDNSQRNHLPPVFGSQHWCLSASSQPIAAAVWAHFAMTGPNLSERSQSHWSGRKKKYKYMYWIKKKKICIRKSV